MWPKFTKTKHFKERDVSVQPRLSLSLNSTFFFHSVWRTEELAANTIAHIPANVTHFSDSLAASFWPSPLEQNSLTPCRRAGRGGPLQPLNAAPLPGDLPFGAAPVLKQVEAAGAALTPTLPVHGRLSCDWNNSLSAAVERKCNISIPSKREGADIGTRTKQNKEEGEIQDTAAGDECRLLGRVTVFSPGDSTTETENSSVDTTYPSQRGRSDWLIATHGCTWLARETVCRHNYHNPLFWSAVGRVFNNLNI